MDRIDKLKEISASITEKATLEAKINAKNFISWWIRNYPDENAKVTLEVKLNKNIRRNGVILLKRMKEWKESLKYGLEV